MILPYFSPNADKVSEEVHEERMVELHYRMKEMFVDAIKLMKKYGWGF